MDRFNRFSYGSFTGNRGISTVIKSMAGRTRIISREKLLLNLFGLFCNLFKRFVLDSVIDYVKLLTIIIIKKIENIVIEYLFI